ncbi:MAG: hypothetical protein LBB15_01310 [Puniceicoccales bacterium]|jgi:hypothetical protein|nr:hypothetical protein [Puniceicoccales bacterium]
MNYDISSLSIKVTNVDEYGNVTLKVGDIPAAICDPKPGFLAKNLVYLVSIDHKFPSWEDILLEKEIIGRKYRGFSDDPRLVQIAKDVFDGKVSESLIGKEIL